VRTWIVAGVAALAFALALALADRHIAAQTQAPAKLHQQAEASIVLPPGYRNWQLISVTALGPPFSDIRAKLGNAIAMGDFRNKTLPHRDGAIIVRLAWRQIMDPATNAGMRLEAQQKGLDAAATAKLLRESIEAGAPTNVQLMMKDSKRFASTGGWGFAQFTNGKRDMVITDPRNPRSCFVCHQPAKSTDFVFTRYAL
jgi:hypothetical protein